MSPDCRDPDAFSQLVPVLSFPLGPCQGLFLVMCSHEEALADVPLIGDTAGDCELVTLPLRARGPVACQVSLCIKCIAFQLAPAVCHATKRSVSCI